MRQLLDLSTIDCYCNVITPRPSRLQAEIHQARPFASPAQEGVLGLARTADLLNRWFDRLFAPHDITRVQYNVLRILRGAGPEGMPTLSVAERLIVQAPGITRLLDRLEAKGLVRRERCRADRRQVLCWITPRGLGLLEALDAPVREAEEGFLSMLSRGDQAELIRLLDRIRAGQAG